MPWLAVARDHVHEQVVDLPVQALVSTSRSPSLTHNDSTEHEKAHRATGSAVVAVQAGSRRRPTRGHPTTPSNDASRSRGGGRGRYP